MFDRLPANLKITFKPILFAGLLKHWEHKGPAEIPEKRKFTYRFIQWKAGELGISLKFPPAHPFNPVKLLRLAVALDANTEAIGKIFDFIWRDGQNVSDDAALTNLGKILGVENINAIVENPTVKEKLIQNGKDALAHGVFGVPTFLIDGELFWGADSLEMFNLYLKNPDFLKTAEMRRISELPEGTQRVLPHTPITNSP